MDELSEEDKLTVARARKIQRFMSQPFAVAEVFTSMQGKLCSLEETISGFEQILEGDLDSIHEQAFYMVGSLDDVHAKAKALHEELVASGLVEDEDEGDAPKKVVDVSVEADKYLSWIDGGFQGEFSSDIRVPNFDKK
jgi:hypothetical protein